MPITTDTVFSVPLPRIPTVPSPLSSNTMLENFTTLSARILDLPPVCTHRSFQVPKTSLSLNEDTMNPQSPNYDHLDRFLESLTELIGDPENEIIGRSESRPDIEGARID